MQPAVLPAARHTAHAAPALRHARRWVSAAAPGGPRRRRRAAAAPLPCTLAGHSAQCAPAAHVKVRAPPVFPRRCGKPSGRARRCPWRRRLALARTRRDARQRRSGWPWRRSLRWRRVDRWRAGAGRWQALRKQGKAPARAWGRWGGVREVFAVGRSLRSIRPPLAPALRAAKDVRPSALSPSPPGECQGVGPARRLARPTRQSARLSAAWHRSG